MPLKIRQLKADLRRLGFSEDTVGGKGSHSKWTHPLLPGITIILSGRDGDDAHHYQERAVRDAQDQLKMRSLPRRMP
jgi:hypothetical protein